MTTRCKYFRETRVFILVSLLSPLLAPSIIVALLLLSLVNVVLVVVVRFDQLFIGGDQLNLLVVLRVGVSSVFFVCSEWVRSKLAVDTVSYELKHRSKLTVEELCYELKTL